MLPKNKPGKPGIIMNNHGSISIPTIILLISFTLVGFTVASVINEESDVATEDQIDEILDDVLNEVTTYIQIKDKIGKYSELDNQQKIQ